MCRRVVACSSAVCIVSMPGTRFISGALVVAVFGCFLPNRRSKNPTEVPLDLRRRFRAIVESRADCCPFVAGGSKYWESSSSFHQMEHATDGSVHNQQLNEVDREPAERTPA